MTFPLMEVDEFMVDAILQSINNPENHFIPVVGTHTEEEREEDRANDGTLSDMSELTSLSELDREAESVIDGTAFAIPLHSRHELFRCGYKGCSTQIANNRNAIESHLRQAHPAILPPKNGCIGRTTHCRWPGCESRHLINTDNIWRHIAEMHWGSLAHRCAVCRRSFSRKDSCGRHIRQKHAAELMAASKSC
ncbi:hypothetical protein PILCRDRAFT_821333 [Piloderma croceum F 1598]|uniref:C2H2-type domain-containing protein n=1 Tax=Piloderma croceum (strain F 1598) TaxID=765440 RepID=A0A0C3FP26_PILCF|nr:hypothetical protein PILCRDRAFT_821333 [Piloderma croceum F 1598]